MRFPGELAFALFVLSALSASAQNYLNPGTMGANALPPQAGESPLVGQHLSAMVGLAAQQADDPSGATDYSATFPFRVEATFKQRATLFVEGTPMELWVTSALTRAEWRTEKWAGVSRADLRFGSKFNFYEGNRFVPAISLRVMTKTTTGKDLKLHRFLNAPAYQLDLLVGHRFEVGRGVALEAWASGGFLAWQQSGFGQNDAVAGSLTVAARSGPFFFSAELRGYRGWERDDKPFVLAGVAEVRLSEHFVLRLGAWRSFQDPVSVDLRVALRFEMLMPEVLR